MSQLERAWVTEGGPRPGCGEFASWGAALIGSAEYREFIADGCHGKARVPMAALTSASDSAGALIVLDRDADGVLLRAAG